MEENRGGRFSKTEVVKSIAFGAYDLVEGFIGTVLIMTMAGVAGFITISLAKYYELF